MSIIDEDARVQGIEEAMSAEGVSTTIPQQASYFGFEETHRCFLPDKVSYIEHKTLNEGARRTYLNKVNRDIRLQRATGDAIMKMQAGEERHALLVSAICGWNLVDSNGTPIVFSKSNLEKFLTETNPRIVDLVEKDVKKRNPWLLQEMTSDDIKEQISQLEEMLEVKLREEEGKES